MKRLVAHSMHLLSLGEEHFIQVLSKQGTQVLLLFIVLFGQLAIQSPEN